jgi:hypothetical protein
MSERHGDEYSAVAGPYDDLPYAKLRDPSGDAAFYLDLAQGQAAQCLEIGCGSGRVLLPIAREERCEGGRRADGLEENPWRSKYRQGNHLVARGLIDKSRQVVEARLTPCGTAAPRLRENHTPALSLPQRRYRTPKQRASP